MNVKKFEFPAFEQWFETRKDYKQKIGDYTCDLDLYSCNPSAGIETYMIVIAASDYPRNIYVNKTVVETFDFDKSNLNKSKIWYEQATARIKRKWEYFIRDQYLI